MTTKYIVHAWGRWSRCPDSTTEFRNLSSAMAAVRFILGVKRITKKLMWQDFANEKCWNMPEKRDGDFGGASLEIVKR